MTLRAIFRLMLGAGDGLAEQADRPTLASYSARLNAYIDGHITRLVSPATYRLPSPRRRRPPRDAILQARHAKMLQYNLSHARGQGHDACDAS